MYSIHYEGSQTTILYQTNIKYWLKGSVHRTTTGSSERKVRRHEWKHGSSNTFDQVKDCHQVEASVSTELLEKAKDQGKEDYGPNYPKVENIASTELLVKAKEDYYNSHVEVRID